MHSGAKIAFLLGAILLLGGVIIAIVGGSTLRELEGNQSLTLLEVSNGSVTIDDIDGKGDVGVTFWVKGKYLDEDNDGEWDHCEMTNITIVSLPETNSDWDEGLEGDFRYEVNHEGVFDGCEADRSNTNYDRDGQGLIKVGRACLACYSGVIEFESNQTVWVSYDDPILEKLGLGFMQMIGGFVTVFCSVIVVVVGIIVAVSTKDSVENSSVILNAEGAMVVAQPALGITTIPADVVEDISSASSESEDNIRPMLIPD